MTRPGPGVPGLIELPVANIHTATGFYRALFPHWGLTEWEPGRSCVADTGGGCLIAFERRQNPSLLRAPLIYFGVRGLEAALDRVVAASGTVHSAPRPVAAPATDTAKATLSHYAAGRYAKVRGTDGTLIGLWDPDGLG